MTDTLMNYFHLQVSKPLTVADEEKLKANFKIPTQIGPEDVKTQDRQSHEVTFWNS